MWGASGGDGPLVSIGVPVFNGERFLAHTLDHLRAQDLTRFEIVISDNGSTDGTQDICRQAAVVDERILYHRSPQNRGMAWNFNRTLELARAPLFMWNAADDLMLPTYLSSTVRMLDENRHAVLAFTRMQYIDEFGDIMFGFDDEHLDLSALRPRDRVQSFLRSEAFHAVFGVMPTKLLRSLGGLPIVRGDDVILGVRLLLLGSFALAPEPLMRLRLHDDQASMIGNVVDQVREHRPDTTVRLAFPWWHMHAELYRWIMTSSLPMPERLACASVVARVWSIRKWRQLAGDVKRNLVVMGELAGEHLSRSRPDAE